jgi:hypothetical protein
MPRVPTYNAPQVETRALPGVRQSSIASPSLLGAGAEQQIAAGQGLLQAGTGIANAAVQAQERENIEKVQAADAAYKERLLEWKLSAANKYQGVNADAMLGDFQQWHDKQSKELDQGFGNDAQRHVFTGLARKNYNLARADFGQLVLSEKSKTQAAALDATLRNEINLAAIAGSDEEVAVRKRSIVANVNAFGAAKGWDEATTIQKRGQALTKLHLNRVQNIVDKDHEAAMAYFEANKGEIDGADQAEVHKYIQASVERKESKQLRDEARLHASQARTERAAADQAWGILAKTGDLDAVPAAVIARMDGRARFSLLGEAKRLASGEFVATDWGTYTELRNMAANDPERFQRQDLRSYYDKLNPKEREGLLDLQGKTSKAPDEVATLSQQLTNAHRLLGLRDGMVEKKGQFDAAAFRAINAEQKRVGKDLSFDERQKVIDRLMLDGEIKGAWFGGTKNKNYQVQGTADADKWQPKIGKDERVRIEAALKRNGEPVTEENINNLFRRRYGL